MELIKKYFYLLPSALMTLSALPKIFLFRADPEGLPLAGLEEKLLPLGILELCCVVIFVIPRTMNLGFLLICCYLGGAIAVNLVINTLSPLIPAVLLGLFWIGMFPRNKTLFTF